MGSPRHVRKRSCGSTLPSGSAQSSFDKGGRMYGTTPSSPITIIYADGHRQYGCSQQSGNGVRAAVGSRSIVREPRAQRKYDL